MEQPQNCGYKPIIVNMTYSRAALKFCHCSGHEQESPADARVTRDSAVIPRWPSAAILDIIEPEIAPCDPLTPKTLA